MKFQITNRMNLVNKCKQITIAVLNQKGGSGKTTIATNLSHGLILQGYKVLLIDGDPQRSARDWNEANDAKLVPCVGLDSVTLATDIKAVSFGYDVLIIDGAPQTARLAVAAIKAADVVLIPVQPSPYDVWAVSDLVELLKTRQEVANGKPDAAFIISQARKNTLLGDQVEEALSDYKLPLLKSRTTRLTAYAQTATNGESVFCSPCPATLEFKGIVDEVISKYLECRSS